MSKRFQIGRSASTAVVSPRESDRVEEELRRLIVTLELPPGASITETSLSEHLNCSRVPVREALQRLAHNHMVVLTPRRGVSIPELSVIQYGQLFEFITAMDGMMLPLAAERISDEQLVELEAIVARAEAARQAGNLAGMVELNVDFHGTIAQATQNALFVEAYVRACWLNARFVYLGLKGDDLTQVSLEDHRRLIAALRKRDSKESKRVALEHDAHAQTEIVAGMMGIDAAWLKQGRRDVSL